MWQLNAFSIIPESINDYNENTNEKIEKREKREKINSNFNRWLSYWVEWEDVKTLQDILISLWYDLSNDYEWTFWDSTEQALKDFQEEELGFTNPDWVMDLNWKTMRALKEIQHNLALSDSVSEIPDKKMEEVKRNTASNINNNGYNNLNINKTYYNWTTRIRREVKTNNINVGTWWSSISIWKINIWWN